jgi:hypothetical protein
VEHDAPEPGRQRGLASEGADVDERQAPRLLEHVLGLGIVADDGASHAKQALVVAPDQRFEGRALAGAEPGHDLGIGEGWLHADKMTAKVRGDNCNGV